MGESVSSVMETLMRTPVVPVAGGRDKRGRKKERGDHQDPRVVMDMRHKQVIQNYQMYVYLDIGGGLHCAVGWSRMKLPNF